MDGKGKIGSGNESMKMMASTRWWKSVEELTRILEELVDEKNWGFTKYCLIC